MTQDLTQLAEQVGQQLHSRHLRLVTAESCTGGWVSQAITAISGSSNWFERGFVTYSNEAKQEMLGVNAKTLEKHGAVSEEVAQEMVQGALTLSHADISIAITGIAGPEGGSEDKPVGTVCFAIALVSESIAWTENFSGDREAVRRAAVQSILESLINFLSSI